MNPQKSIGHIFFHGGYEYMHIGGNNSVYRAPIGNPMEQTRFGPIRTGARFESTYTAWVRSPTYLTIVEGRSKELDRILDEARLQRFQASGSDAPAPVQMYERD